MLEHSRLTATAALGGLLLAAVLVGCDDSSLQTTPLGTPTGVAVLNSDYQSTSVSLLDPEGTALVRDECLITSVPGAGGTPTLSGDVVLPSEPQLGHDLVLIDRTNAAISWVDPTTCGVRRQMSVATGFDNVNPRDIVRVATGKAYVTRYARNLAPLTDPNGAGDDLLIVDPSQGTILGRIDMAPHAATVAGAEIWARPDRAILAGGRVYVTLGNQDALYANAGEGRVVVVDPEQDAVVATVALTGLVGCSQLAYDPASTALYVACGGSFAAADQAAASGIAVVDVSGAAPVLDKVIPASAFGGQPVNLGALAVVGPGVVLASTFGAFPDASAGTAAVPDAVHRLDVASETAGLVMQGEAFAIGAFAATATRAFIPNAPSTSAGRVHVFDLSAGGAVSDTRILDANPAHGLPPRAAAWY